MFEIFFTSANRAFDPRTHVTFPVKMRTHVTRLGFKLGMTEFAVIDLPTTHSSTFMCAPPYLVFKQQSSVVTVSNKLA